MKTIIILSITCFLMAALPAAAQERKADNFALEEVIVTAQKKAELLQDTPISITVYNSEQLEIGGITGLEDLNSKVPAVTIEPFPTTKTTLIIYMRGVGIEDVQLTQDPSVGIYLDGVYLARSSGTALELADLERIEVLRGPQGTLYGRNTTGGAINLVTLRPDMESLSFKQNITIGNRNRLTAKSTVNIPVLDNVAIKLGALHITEDGFVENIGPGGDFGDTEVSAWRFDMRWDITGATSLDYAYDNSDIDHYNYLYQGIQPAFGDKGSLEIVKQTAIANSVFSRDRLDELQTGPPLEENSTDMEGHSLILTHNFTESLSFKYIGSRRELLDRAYYEFGGGKGSLEYRLDSNSYDGPAAMQGLGGPSPLTYNTIAQEQLSHEMQLSGNWGDSFEYVVGAYYFEEEGSDKYPLHLLVRVPLDNVPNTALVIFQDADYSIENEAWAGFFQLTWKPSIFDERLGITWGMRHSADKREALKSLHTLTFGENTILGVSLGAPGGTGLLPLPSDFDAIPAGRRFEYDSFSFVLSYELTGDINLYAKAVDSYKSGGFNVRDPQRGRTGNPATDDSNQAAADGQVYGFGYVDGFEQESVLSYELGIKSEFLGSRLRVNAATYLAEFKDRQMNFVIDTTISDSKTTNAGEAEVRGLELDVMWLVSRKLLLSLNYAYLDADVTNVQDAFGRDRTNDFEFFSAPPHTYTAGVDYTIWSGDFGRIALNLSYNFVDNRNGDSRSFTNNIELRQAYDLVNARLSLTEVEVLGGKLNLALWGKNLEDTEYYVAGATSIPHADHVALWGDARSYGLDLIYEWKQ